MPSTATKIRKPENTNTANGFDAVREKQATYVRRRRMLLLLLLLLLHVCSVLCSTAVMQRVSVYATGARSSRSVGWHDHALGGQRKKYTVMNIRQQTGLLTRILQ